MEKAYNYSQSYVLRFQKFLPIISWEIFIPMLITVSVVWFLQSSFTSEILDVYQNLQNSGLLVFIYALLILGFIFKKVFSVDSFIAIAKQCLALLAIFLYITVGLLAQVQSFSTISTLKIPSFAFLSVCISILIGITIIFQGIELGFLAAVKPELNQALEINLVQNVIPSKIFLCLLVLSFVLPFLGTNLKFTAINNLNFCIFFIINLQSLFFKNYDRTFKSLQSH